MAVGRVLEKALGMEEEPPRLTEAEVLGIARMTAQEQAWPWEDPVSVTYTPGSRRKGGRWHIMTNARCRGGNVNVHISDKTGAVYHKGFAPY